MRSTPSLLRAAGTFGRLLRDAYREFQLNDPLRMAAATSFFASFALPPIMIILIRLFGLFSDPRSVRQGLFEQLGRVFDKNIASQVREILRNIHYLPLNRGMQITGFLFLLFVATTLFEIIKNSLNQLWKIKLKERPGVGFLLFYRVKSIAIIVMAGLLFSMVLLGDARGWFLPEGFNDFLYHGITTLAAIAWFILILKYLSYGRPAWQTAIAGGVFTGLLFSAGEVLLHLVLSYNGMKTIYGASTSMVLLLLFVFYCSFIFYFGACFTQALAISSGCLIQPVRHATRYRQKSVDT